MSASDAAAMLRPGLLDGVGVLLAGAAPGPPNESLGEAAASACVALGAALARCPAPDATSPERMEADSDRAVSAALGDLERIDVLVLDAASLLAASVPGAAETTSPSADPVEATTPSAAALGDCLQATWALTRAVFNLAFAQAHGRVLYLAPRDAGGMHEHAALAGLENLSRTLSVEWARHGVTAVTIAPGRTTPAGEVAALTAYLASPAGAYFSGCLLDLRGPGAAARLRG
jgi:citronellol/citronellal dehydrogenase